jgi:hypothetical protein
MQLLRMGLCGLLQHVLHYRKLLCQLLLLLPRWLLHLYPTAILQPLLLLHIWCCYLQPGPDASKGRVAVCHGSNALHNDVPLLLLVKLHRRVHL